MQRKGTLVVLRCLAAGEARVDLRLGRPRALAFRSLPRRKGMGTPGCRGSFFPLRGAVFRPMHPHGSTWGLPTDSLEPIENLAGIRRPQAPSRGVVTVINHNTLKIPRAADPESQVPREYPRDVRAHG